MKHIGIYSGSFDPIHEGHIAFAEEAMKTCGLETILFLPERFPRGKPNVSPISERLTELEITLANKPFLVGHTHTDRFTVDETLTELETLYPNTHFTFLIGSDVALNLPNWPNIERLASRYDFAVGMREGDTKQAVTATLSRIVATYTLFETKYGHVSSRNLRTRKY